MAVQRPPPSDYRIVWKSTYNQPDPPPRGHSAPGFHPTPRRARPLASACREPATAISGRSKPNLQGSDRRYAQSARRLNGFRLRAGILIWAQISPSVLPSHAISRGARCQIGLPGTPAGSKLACRWQIGQRIAGSANTKIPAPALDRWLMQPGRIALARAVAGRMAVQTPRMRQHLAQLREYCR